MNTIPTAQELIQDKFPKLYRYLTEHNSRLLQAKPIYGFNNYGEAVVMDWINTTSQKPSKLCESELLIALQKECQRTLSYFSCFVYEDWDDDTHEQIALKIGLDHVGVNFTIDPETDNIVPLLDGPFTESQDFINRAKGGNPNIRGALGWTINQYFVTKKMARGPRYTKLSSSSRPPWVAEIQSVKKERSKFTTSWDTSRR